MVPLGEYDREIERRRGFDPGDQLVVVRLDLTPRRQRHEWQCDGACYDDPLFHLGRCDQARGGEWDESDAEYEARVPVAVQRELWVFDDDGNTYDRIKPGPTDSRLAALRRLLKHS